LASNPKEKVMTKRFLATALLGSTLALTSVGLSAQSADAGWNGGVFSFGGRAATMTRTFRDPSPAKTPVALVLQKKTGGYNCRAQVTVTSGGYIFRSRWVYKHTRNRSRAYGTVIRWPNRVQTTTITVKTNGHCIYRVGAK